MHTQAHERPSLEQLNSTELKFEQLEAVSGGLGLMNNLMTNLMQMEHEVLKAYANNLRA
jgi:hypothetical protein